VNRKDPAEFWWTLGVVVVFVLIVVAAVAALGSGWIAL
jgi:hypothetical protein